MGAQVFMHENDRAPLFKGAHATMRLALPLMAAQLAVIAFGVVDTVTFSAYGQSSLAAGGLALAVLSLVNIILVGVLAAVGIEVSHLIGKPPHLVRRQVEAGLLLSIILAVPAIGLMFFSPHILTLLGQEDEIAALAGTYLVYAAPSLLANLIFTTFRGQLVGLRMPGPITTITVAALGLKIVLNLIILRLSPVSVHEDAIAYFLGACGLASTIVTFAMAAALWGYCVKKHPSASPVSLRPQFEWANVIHLAKLGAPIGFTYGIESGYLTVITIIVGQFGSAYLAAHNIVNQCIYLSFMIAVGISHATSVNIGNAIGSGSEGEVRRLGLQGIVLGLGVMTATAGIFLFFGGQIVGLFLPHPGSERSEVYSTAVAMLAIAALFQWADGTQNIAMGALRGMRRANISMICGLVGFWLVGISAAFILSRVLGPLGAWWGMLAGFYATAALLTFCFLRSSAGNPPAIAQGTFKT